MLNEEEFKISLTDLNELIGIAWDKPDNCIVLVDFVWRLGINQGAAIRLCIDRWCTEKIISIMVINRKFKFYIHPFRTIVRKYESISKKGESALSIKFSVNDDGLLVRSGPSCSTQIKSVKE